MKTVLAKCGWLCTLFCYLAVFNPSCLLLPDTGGDLLAAVQTVQRLSHNAFSDAGFRTVFVRALDSMQAAAGMKSLAGTSTASEDCTSQAVLATVARPPHLAARQVDLPVDLFSVALPPPMEVWTYESITLPPDTPPPIRVVQFIGCPPACAWPSGHHPGTLQDN